MLIYEFNVGFVHKRACSFLSFETGQKMFRERARMRERERTAQQQSNHLIGQMLRGTFSACGILIRLSSNFTDMREQSARTKPCSFV